MDNMDNANHIVDLLCASVACNEIANEVYHGIANDDGRRDARRPRPLGGPRELRRHGNGVWGVSVMTSSEPRVMVRLANGYLGHGLTGERRTDGRCSNCGGSGFTYNNGHEWSRDGVRGYRCDTCATIKPERR